MQRPAPLPTSSSEDELDIDQLPVMDQLLTIEQVCGLATVVHDENGERGRQHLTKNNFASVVFTRLSCLQQATPQSQPMQAFSQQSQLVQVIPQQLNSRRSVVAAVLVPASPVGLMVVLEDDQVPARTGSGQVGAAVIFGIMTATSSAVGEPPISWPWGHYGNLIAPAMVGTPLEAASVILGMPSDCFTYRGHTFPSVPNHVGHAFTGRSGYGGDTLSGGFS